MKIRTECSQVDGILYSGSCWNACGCLRLIRLEQKDIIVVQGIIRRKPRGDFSINPRLSQPYLDNMRIAS